MNSNKWRILKLQNRHDFSSFDCGENILNEYLKKFSGQHTKKNISRSFVMTTNDNLDKVLGFYTVSAGDINFHSLSEKLQKKLPKYPIPIVRIGRLAIDKSIQNQGAGEFLLMDALYRCVTLSEEMGIFGVVVDAKHEKAKSFYLKYGFSNLTDLPLTLFISIQNIIASISENSLINKELLLEVA